MKSLSFDKSSILLIVIIGIVVGLSVFLALSLRSDAVEEAIKSDRILNIVVILELDGEPSSTELFLFYPSTGRGAVLDVPADTGLILKSVKRVDRIASVYGKGRPRAYLDEISQLLGTDIPYWLIMDEKGLSGMVDLSRGIELFVPHAIDEKGPPRVLLPQGALVLDGEKVLQYASYRPAGEDDADATARRQKLFQAIVRRLGERSEWLGKPGVFPLFRRNIETNLSDEALKRLLVELSHLDADRLLLQRITGTWRTVDGKRLIFPHYDGELVRDIVKQTLNALSSADQTAVDKIYTVEILNGTPSKGLASRTAEIFQSFGYDVVSIGNADRDDYQKSVVIDQFSNPLAAKNLAEVIRCSNLSESAGAASEASADFTVILGRDFNGRYCSAQ